MDTAFAAAGGVPKDRASGPRPDSRPPGRERDGEFGTCAGAGWPGVWRRDARRRRAIPSRCSTPRVARAHRFRRLASPGGRPWWSTLAMALIGVLTEFRLRSTLQDCLLQHLLRGGGEERDGKLEGLLLRLARPVVVHHSGQAASFPLGHGDLGRIFGFSSVTMWSPSSWPALSPCS